MLLVKPYKNNHTWHHNVFFWSFYDTYPKFYVGECLAFCKKEKKKKMKKEEKKQKKTIIDYVSSQP
jgi:hypothetical protein